MPTSKTAPKLAAAPILLTVQPWDDYAVVDTGIVNGSGRKLEQVGPFLISRPEPSALWPQADAKSWPQATAAFASSKEDEEAAGQWSLQAEWPDKWPMQYGDIQFWGRRTNFRHIGFFPEQEAQWRWLSVACAKLSKKKSGPRILNLFGYSGVMSLVSAAAGAVVTHVDASKKSVGWARENAALSSMEAAPIRWIVDDAAKFAAREVRRGSSYEGIILDPPKFGRGPDGETWDFFRDLPGLLGDCAKLLSGDAGFIILTGYSARLSARSLAELLASHLPERGGTIDYGDYTLEDKAKRQLGLALFARWSTLGVSGL